MLKQQQCIGMPKAWLGEKSWNYWHHSLCDYLGTKSKCNIAFMLTKLRPDKSFWDKKVNIWKGVWLHLPRKTGKNIPKCILNQGPPRASMHAYNKVQFYRMNFIKQDCLIKLIWCFHTHGDWVKLLNVSFTIETLGKEGWLKWKKNIHLDNHLATHCF